MVLPDLLARTLNVIWKALLPDSKEPLKAIGSLTAIITTILSVITFILTQILPWLRAKWRSHTLEERVGAELYPAATIERSIRYYIEPDCQSVDPMGGEEPRLVLSTREKLFGIIDRVVNRPTQYRYLFLLADSGMGKTSALLNYYVRHFRRWRRQKYNLTLIPLGISDADARIEAIEEKDRHKTILFLDAFDEDTLAIVDHVERLRLLLKATLNFHLVLISCRTQFFASDEEIPVETGTLKVFARAADESAEYTFHKIYLSPFSDAQVLKYLRRRYPFWRFWNRKLAWKIVEKIPYLAVRPMLLAHIDDLVNAKREFHRTVDIYEEMVQAWLERERGFVNEKEALKEFSERLAVDIYIKRADRKAESVPKPELSQLANNWGINLDEWKLSGRSLLNRDARGNYKFAHRSIMEYLYARFFITQVHLPCLTVEWTDQMHSFLWEMLQNGIAKQQILPFHDQVWVKQLQAHENSIKLSQALITLLCDVAEKRLRSFHKKANSDETYNLLATVTGVFSLVLDLEIGNLGTFSTVLLKSENTDRKRSYRDINLNNHVLFYEARFNRSADGFMENRDSQKANINDQKFIFALDFNLEKDIVGSFVFVTKNKSVAVSENSSSISRLSRLSDLVIPILRVYEP